MIKKIVVFRNKKDLQKQNRYIQKAFYTKGIPDWDRSKHRFTSGINRVKFDSSLDELIRTFHYISKWPSVNERGLILAEIVVPNFFEKFRGSEFWIIEEKEEWIKNLWDSEEMLKEKYKIKKGKSIFPRIVPDVLEPMQLQGVHSFYLSLKALQTSFYPFINFVFYWAGNLYPCFFVKTPLQVIEEPGVEPEKELLISELYDIFSEESIWTKRSIREPPVYSWDYKKVLNYQKSYIESVSKILDCLLAIKKPDRKMMFILTYTMLAFEQCLINISSLPFVRKLLFFRFLDKMARLYKELSRSKEAEWRIWELLVSRSFFRDNVSQILEKIPEPIKSYYINLSKRLFFTLKLTPSQLKAIRNSQHGLFKSKTFKKIVSVHNEVPDLLPDYSIILWNYLIFKKW